MRWAGAEASVLGREAVRELDARTIASGTPSIELMERAAAAIADALFDSSFHGVSLPDRPRLLVVAGRGNNGGDGFAVARLLASRRWRCTVALASGEPVPGGDAAANLAEWRRIGGRVVEVSAALAEASGESAPFDLLLDAVYGTGLVRPVEGADADLIHRINASGLPVVAVDIPSGLCADTGVPLGVAVVARATVTIGAAKPGLFLAEGPGHCGRTVVAGIGLLDPAGLGITRAGVVVDDATTRASWPRLSPLAHKGNRGHVLVVAGSRGKTGAAVLAARGALRAGAGLVTVASTADVQAAVSAALPEAMTHTLDSDPHGRVGVAAVDALTELAAAADAVVVGPGLGKDPGCEALVACLAGASAPVVLDADALNLVSGWDTAGRREVFASRLASGAPRAILTPHPGEMSRLCEATTAQIQVSRKTFADKLAQELGVVVLLKGAATVVSDGSRTAFNLSGNAGMATGGMGDVLSGICAALAVRLGDPFEAAALAAWVHGRAGDLAAEGAGGPGFLAGEVADLVPGVLATRWPR